jgi:hypothetical protein
VRSGRGELEVARNWAGSRVGRLDVYGEGQLLLQFDELRDGRVAGQGAGQLEDVAQGLIALALIVGQGGALLGLTAQYSMECDGEQLCISIGVAEAMTGDRVTVVAGVADQPRPSRCTPVTVTPARTSAPARPAAEARMVSSTYRRGATTQSTPALWLTVRVSDSPAAWKVTCRMAGAPLSRTWSSSPQRRSWTTPLRAIEWVDSVSLGNHAWSTTTTS